MIKVTAVQHPNGVITAFINVLPCIVVQGKDEKDVSRKLDIALDSYMKRLNNMRDNYQIETKEYI